MPAGKRKEKRRKTGRQRGALERPSPWEDLKATGRTASRALAVFKGASSLLNAEVKYMDVGASATSSSTPAVVYLSGCAVGDTQSDRNGMSIKLKGGLIKLMLTANTSAARTTQRIMIIADTACQKANPSATDVVDTTRITGLLNLLTWTNRFVVLHDETTVVGTTSGSGLNAWWKTIDLAALVDAHVNYSGSGAAVTTAGALAIFMLHWNNEATNTATLAYDSRLYFVDN